MIVAINIINRSVLEDFQHTIERIAGPAQLEVTLGVGEVGFPESTVAIVRSDPDVSAAVALVRGTLALASEPGETLQVFGVDFTAEKDLERYRMTVATADEDRVVWLADPHSIVLPTPLAAELGIGIGDNVTLLTPQGILPFTVRGLLEPEGLARAFGGRIALMDLPAAQAILGKEDRIDQIEIVVRPGADIATVKQRLAAAAVPSTLSVGEPAQRGTQYEKILSSFQAMLVGLSLLCLVAGIYIIYNTTSTAAVHRALVFAGLRVIGADAGQLFRLLMLEAAIVGIVGTLIGTAAGIGLAHVLSGMVSKSIGVIFQLRVPVDSLDLDPWAHLMIGFVGVGAALLASYFAARQVTSLQPLDGMRTDIYSLPGRTRSAFAVWAWVGLVLISAAALGLEVHYKSSTWGNIGSTLWVASSIVIAIPIVRTLAPILSRFLTRFFGAEGRVASESLNRSSTRTGVTVAAIALVLTIAITCASLSLSHRRSVASYFSGGFLASDLAVSAVSTEGGWLETPLPISLETEILAISGVQSTETARVLPGQMYRGQRIALAALSDGLFDPARYPTGWYRAGDPARAADAIRAGEGIVVSLNFADRFGVHLGDSLDLDSATGQVTLRVVGIVPLDTVADRGVVLLSRRVFIERWRDSAVNWILASLDAGASRDAVRSRIAEHLRGRYLLKILTPSERAAFHANQVERAYAFTYAIQLLVVIITVAGIFDLLMAAIWERRRELALWRVIGANESVVRRSVVIESGTIGAIGTVLGIIIGVITTWIWISINYRYQLGYYIDYYFAFGTTVWLVALVMVATIIVGYSAARHATRQPVLEGIQIE